MSVRLLHEQAIFEEARKAQSPEARQALLDQRCGQDDELKGRVAALLRASEESQSFLESPPPGLDSVSRSSELPAIERPIAERPGTVIGPYKLLQQIGEGGMGVVFMAEQSEPIQRTVALKIIKPGMDTRQVIARFEAERQALAMMDHPNIARVVDAGTTDTGRPYFVMDLVKGIPITEYCDEKQLSLRQRLELFKPVCEAVQHAHQKGIIHRDLKPSNVLVAEYDGKPIPKVIDFGVAKATAKRLTEQTMFTEYGQLIGTFEYMSPEQATFNQLDVDTRSDIYSLGVVLYELLAGSTPLEKKRLRTAAFGEILRIIGEEDPPRPSLRLSSNEMLPSISAQRKIEPAKLTKLIAGELDWIVMKCLDKDRQRRYETANALAVDLQRYLADEPVEARSASRTYRFKKFIRRNRVGVLAGSAIVAALAVGLAVATVGFVRARTEATRSEQVAQFLKEMLAAAGPSVARGRDASLLRDLLDKTAERIDKDLQHQPEVQGDLWMTLGKTYTDVGDHSLAVSMYQHAVDSFRLALGNENPKLALALGRLGLMQSHNGTASTGRANAELGLQMARQCGDKTVIARCLDCSARAVAGDTLLRETIPQFREAISLEKEAGDDPVFLAHLMLCLGGCLDEPGAHDEAESLMRQALALQRQHLGADHPAITSSLYLLTQCMIQQKRLDEAETLARETVALSQKVYSVYHPSPTAYVAMLSSVLSLRDKSQEAEAVLNEAVKSSPLNGGRWRLLGEFNGQRGNLIAAVEQFSRAAQLAPNDNGIAINLATALLSTDQIEPYRAHCHEFLERSANTREPSTAEVAAKASLLLPGDGPDFDRACQLADFAASATEQIWRLSWIRNTKALADYRRRRYESAIDWAERASSTADSAAACKASDCCIQACCYAQLQRLDLARSAVAEADRITLLGHDKTREEYYAAWEDWFTAELLRREAAELIEQQAADTGEKPAITPSPPKGGVPTDIKNSTPPASPTTND